MTSNPSVNQLNHFLDIGLLKTKDGPRPDVGKAPKWANWADTAAALELRSRSYIAGNCPGCHGARGIATGATQTVTLNYDFQDMQPHMDFAPERRL